MAQAHIYEGTLEEITARYGAELAGRKLKVIVEEDQPVISEMEHPLYETATPQEWIQALRDWASSHPLDTPLLSDEAISRDSIYEGRG